MVFPSDMPWYIKIIQGTIDGVMGLFGKNPDKGDNPEKGDSNDNQ